MSALDPIAKRLGSRPDDIIEITRKILVPGTLIKEEIFYREVYMPQKEKKDRAVKK
jgi:DNA-directed RNA polymerase subunit H (RpoH/RPB5)